MGLALTQRVLHLQASIQRKISETRNISIKMLKDVGRTVPKSCSIYAATQGLRVCNNNNKRNPKLSIYAAKQGMRACNNNNMRNPSLHPLISGYACYYCCIPSIPVLLHIYCTCFSTFWHCHPSFPELV